MLINAKKLMGLTVHAKDGDAGEVQAFYFDNRWWSVRYLAVETGSWFNSRRVLVPPASFSSIDISSKRINSNLTVDQIQGSPDVDFNLVLSRGVEADTLRHRGLPRFTLTNEERLLSQLLPHETAEERIMTSRGEKTFASVQQGGMSMAAELVPGARHLFSSDEIFRYRLQATDSDIGNIDDVILDDRTWAIKYLIVDTSQLQPERKVLLSPWRIDRIGVIESMIRINLSKTAINGGPGYDPSRQIDAEYDRNVREYYESVSHLV